MRKFLLILLSIISLGLFTATNANARQIKVDKYVTSSDGCRWHIYGLLDVSVQWGWPPISVNHYDIIMEDPCGKHKFQGIVSPAPSEPGGTIGVQGTLTNETEKIEGSTFLFSVLSQLEAEYYE